jgi:hypothetical protein
MLSAMSKNKGTWKTDMIKTLRITSIIAVVLAVVFFVLPAVFGVSGDEQTEQFLDSAGVIEKFKEAEGDKVKDSRQEISPLVKQAEAFALYLNPAPKPKTKPRVSRSKPRPKGPVSPKFKLVGTSHYALHPALSLALIDEPGKGLRWVRQFSKVGHLVIEQVKDGIIVVRDGTRTFELVAERPEKRSLLKENSSVKIKTSAEEKAAEAERKKALAELDAFLLGLGLEEAQADVEVGEADSGPKAEETAAVKERPISDPETMRIGAREASRLGRLGQRLKDVQRELNRVEDDKAESDANLIEPNLSGLDLNEPDLNDVNNQG